MINKLKSFWYNLFLCERSTVSMGMFRIFVALTVGFHVIPTFIHLDRNYLNETSYRVVNTNFFPQDILVWAQSLTDYWVYGFVAVFLISWLFLLIGYWSQFSMIVLTISCYFFYAVNSFHVGTLSWDILLVTLFLFCWTNAYSDSFSVDALIRGETQSYKKKRLFTIQRLLQLQLGWTFFYTALYKTTAEGNWITANPIFYLMNIPEGGVVKNFLFRSWFAGQETLCYWIGITIVVVEFLMFFGLCWRKSRPFFIASGIFFHIILILTLDVPAIFFFLFPAQFLLWINPDRIVEWIEHKQRQNISSHQPQLFFDGDCQFCTESVKRLEILDLFQKIKKVNFRDLRAIEKIHPELKLEKLEARMGYFENQNIVYGFKAFRQMSFHLPIINLFSYLLFLPGVTFVGNFIYDKIASHRFFFNLGKKCSQKKCKTKPKKKVKYYCEAYAFCYYLSAI